MTETSAVPLAIEAAGWSLGKMCADLVRAAAAARRPGCEVVRVPRPEPVVRLKQVLIVASVCVLAGRDGRAGCLAVGRLPVTGRQHRRGEGRRSPAGPAVGGAGR